MSMMLDLLSTGQGVLDSAATSAEFLARRGSRRSTHFFFFGGGAGALLWIPLLALGLFGAFLVRNPDKARRYKEQLRIRVNNWSSSQPQSFEPTSDGSGRPSTLTVPGAPGRPPRLRLPMRAGPPGAPAVSQITPDPTSFPRSHPSVVQQHPPERFNPPPSWPLPADFTPGPGWAPDPSWPPAPAGWRFWVGNR